MTSSKIAREGLTSNGTSATGDAIDQFREASQSAVTDANKINSLKNLAYVYSTDGKNDLALATFKEALALASPDSSDYYLLSGEVALLEGKPNAALIAYNKAYAKDPESYQINTALALFYIDIEDVYSQYVDYPKALGYAQKAHQINNSNLSKKISLLLTTSMKIIRKWLPCYDPWILVKNRTTLFS